MNHLVDQHLDSLSEKERRELTQLGNKTSSRAALIAFGLSQPSETKNLRLQFQGRKEYTKCRLEYQTGEINCTHQPSEGRTAPRDPNGVLDCRQRWCPHFDEMHEKRIKRAHWAALRQKQKDAQ